MGSLGIKMVTFGNYSGLQMDHWGSLGHKGIFGHFEGNELQRTGSLDLKRVNWGTELELGFSWA